MCNQKVEKWLIEREIKLEESFANALKNLAKKFQKKHRIKNIEEVLSLIGLKKQYIAYWSKNPSSIQTKNFQTQCY